MGMSKTLYCVCLFRLQFEKHLSDHIADIQKEREKEIRDTNLHWQHRVDDLQRQVIHTLSNSYTRSCLCFVNLIYVFYSISILAGGTKSVIPDKEERK